MAEELLDIKDVQRRLRVSERTVFTLIKKRELHGFKVGNKWRFTEGDIKDYEERQRRKAEGIEDAAQPLVCSVIAA